MKRIDVERARQIHAILALCRSKGLDPVPVLDQGRLLRHPGTKGEDAVVLLDRCIQVIRETRVPPEAKTPLDMKNTIIDWLERIKNVHANEH